MLAYQSNVGKVVDVNAVASPVDALRVPAGCVLAGMHPPSASLCCRCMLSLACH